MQSQLYRKFRPNQSPPTELGRDRDYAVDLIPKFIIASGELVKILVHTDVLRYLEFKQIAGSFVYTNNKISKVPSTEGEAVSSPLMGLFEKYRAKKFFVFLQGWKEDDPATHKGDNICIYLLLDYSNMGCRIGSRQAYYEAGVPTLRIGAWHAGLHRTCPGTLSRR